MTGFETLACIVIALAACAIIIGVLHGRAGSGLDHAQIEHLHGRIWRLSESEERYRALVEATTEVIVQRDAQGRITFTNAGFARLMGREPIDLLGSTADLSILAHGPVENRADGVRRIELQIMPKDGTARWFSFIEMPVADAQGLPQLLRAGSDITARVEATRSLDEALHRAETANVAKSRFLATVSHEFRTPLNGILGMADLVLETGLDAEQRTYVEAVRTSGKALLSLIDGILDFSRIEAGRLDLAADPFDLCDLAESVVELLAPRAQDKGIEIALDVADDIPALVIGDADRVRQILTNLAGNAVKFTAQGGVGVSIARCDEGIALSIEDTGPGIPEDRIPVLFEEFEQGDSSASRRHEGTGLGLAITRRLVVLMGGRIDATSTLGEGSLFRVVLPLAGLSEPSPAVAYDDRSVLIVAASPFEAPFLGRRLARSGALVTLVPSTEAAMAALAESPFDSLIADRALGDVAVRTLAVEARRRGVRCSLILLSPFDRREFGAPGAAGFDSYLVKPVRARSLFDRLLAPAPIQADVVETETAAPRPTTSRRLCVLLAEDNAINALLATRALEKLGARVVLARDGLEALAQLDLPANAEAPAFALALIDIRMPGLDGLETARRIRAREAERGLQRLHLVALTANAGPADEEAALKAGFDGFLAKPLDLKALPALLDHRAAA
ncbi:MAG: response regulator [Methylobacterium sp.]|uniref:PAS domain-containing hybrid sensor histidine kinase/response regulator n=1 Tax=Methylobacterium sp. TaxID=409 RepID=UPI0025F8EB27|nr:ATP-binding protein [Methylobacterium sp.]MBX9934077.1 response regulator [Methylobacterium sp.]